MKKLFKENSIYLIILTFAEIILSTVTNLAFVYSGGVILKNTVETETDGIVKLIESIYTSSWWSLILLILAFIAILSLMTMIYKKMDYLGMSICLWIVMLILATDLNKTLVDNLINLLLFIPIIIINIICYKKQKQKIKQKTKKNSPIK